MVDILKPSCAKVVVSNPLKTKAIALSKHKSDRLNACMWHSCYAAASCLRSGSRIAILAPLAAGPSGARRWGLGIDPSGRWLLVANEGSNTVSLFRIDRRTGRLTATGQSLSVPRPAAFAFYPR